MSRVSPTAVPDSVQNSGQFGVDAFVPNLIEISSKMVWVVFFSFLKSTQISAKNVWVFLLQISHRFQLSVYVCGFCLKSPHRSYLAKPVWLLLPLFSLRSRTHLRECFCLKSHTHHDHTFVPEFHSDFEMIQ